MGYHWVSRLRHDPQARRTPDPLVIALAVQPREYLRGTWYLAHDSQPREQLQPIHGKRDVGDSTLGVGAQRITEDFEQRPEDLLAGKNEE